MITGTIIVGVLILMSCGVLYALISWEAFAARQELKDAKDRLIEEIRKSKTHEINK